MENHTPCDICQGTGEVSYFKGESRFLLSHDPCPACNGSGIRVPDGEKPDDHKPDDLQETEGKSTPDNS